MSLFKQLLS